MKTVIATKDSLKFRIDGSTVHKIGTKKPIVVSDEHAEIMHARLGSQIEIKEHKGKPQDEEKKEDVLDDEDEDLDEDEEDEEEEKLDEDDDGE